MPPEPPLPRDFRDGEASFHSGKYEAAVRFYERYIRDDPVTQYRDAAMFRLAIAYALTCAAPECRTKSPDQFKRLISRYPQSPYTAEARFILGLQTDIEKLITDAKAREDRIKKLTDELDRLKKIDLERQPKKK